MQCTSTRRGREREKGNSSANNSQIKRSSLQRRCDDSSPGQSTHVSTGMRRTEKNFLLKLKLNRERVHYFLDCRPVCVCVCKSVCCGYGYGSRIIFAHAPTHSNQSEHGCDAFACLFLLYFLADYKYIVFFVSKWYFLFTARCLIFQRCVAYFISYSLWQQFRPVEILCFDAIFISFL